MMSDQTIVVDDTGTGIDTGAVAGSIFSNDTGTGDDAANIAAQLGVIADTGAGADAALVLVQLGIVADTGTGADATGLLAAILAGDSGQSADVMSPVQAAIYAMDGGSGWEFVSIAKPFFVVDGNTLMPLGVFILQGSEEELLPGTRDYTEEIPGRHGELNFGTELKPRIMEFKVHANVSEKDKAALKRTLAAYLNPLNGAKALMDFRDKGKTTT